VIVWISHVGLLVDRYNCILLQNVWEKIARCGVIVTSGWKSDA